jgi:hypothetical protein
MTMASVYSPDTTTRFLVVIDRQLDPDGQLRTILQEQGCEVVYDADAPECSEQEQVDVCIVNLMRASENDQLARLNQAQGRCLEADVIFVTDTPLPVTPITATSEHVVLTYLCRSVDFIFLANLVGGVMSSKFGMSLHDKAVILEAKSENLRRQDQYTWDVLTLAGGECRDRLNQLVTASEEMLRITDGALSKETTTVMQSVGQNAVSMRCVVNNYLNLARLGNDQLTIHPTLIDPVRDILEPVLVGYASLLKEHRQKFHIKSNRPGLLIWADRSLLVNVYDNLIHNALEFGKQGGNIIFTIMERGNVDECSVWSSGQGLDSQCLESLGEHLTYTAEDVARRNAEIGLYLSRKIVEAHGGSLWAEAQSNAWMNFIFTLPKREAAIRERGKRSDDVYLNACQR